jgi:hypothetical protein
MTKTWTWRRATGQDVAAIVGMAQQDFQTEIDSVFVADPVAYARNVTMAVVTQFYIPHQELLMVCRDQQDQLLAYVWVVRETAPWSDEVMAATRMVHLDLALPTRTRIRIVQEMIGFWEVWARESGIGIVCSTTMRRDTSGFLRIHSAAGYDVRGSIAYKRLS